MNTDMTVGRPTPILLKFLLPLFLGNVFQQLYNMADTIIVGRYVGAGALAAVGSTGTILFLMQGLANGLSTGFAVYTAQSFGAKKMDKVRKSVSNAVILSAIVILILTVFFALSMRGILHLMNTPEDIFKDAESYIMILCYGLVATVYYNLASALLRAIGNSKVPLFFLILAACLNVVLDIVLILNFHMGVAGAALATDISQGVSAILCFAYIYLKVPVLKPHREDWKLHPKISKFQFTIGTPMALQFAITASGTMIMQSAINMFGSDAVAAYTAANKLGNLLTQEMVSMGQTMATYAGQNYGDGKIDRVKQGVRSAVKIEIIYALFAAFLGTVLLKPMLSLFFSADINMDNVLPWAKTYAYISYCFYIPLSMIFLFRNAMQGCGYGFLPMMGGVVELAARLFVALIAMHTHIYTIAASCDPAAWLSAGIFTAVAYIYVIRDIEKKQGL